MSGAAGGRCAVCRDLRTLLLVIGLGTAAGFAVLALGGSSEWSMTVTFLAALAPLLWRARQNRISGKDSE